MPIRYCAGLLSKPTAVAIAYPRGILSGTVPSRCPETQGMLAVSINSQEIQPFLEKLKGHVEDLRLRLAALIVPRAVHWLAT